MYGQYGHRGIITGYDGNSSHSESLSFPGANSKSKKKRVPLLGKSRRTSPPPRMLPLLTALKNKIKDEKIDNENVCDGSDISLMSLPSDLSRDEDDGATPRVNSFLQYSDKEIIENLEGQLYSNTGSQAHLELTSNSISMQETKVSSHNLKCCEVRPEELANVVPESQAVDQISEAYKASGYVNNPEKDFLISKNKDSTHSEYLPAGSLLSNQQQERIFKNNDSSNNLYTLLGQRAKAYHDRVPISSALCVKKEDEKLHMGPPLMYSSVRTNKGGILRNVVNHKDTPNSKVKSIDVRGIPKNMQASEENVKKMDDSNKENEVGLFSSKSAAYNITSAKHGSSCNKIPVFDSNLLHVTKEKDFQILAKKSVALEKQLDEKMEPCMPFCNLNMVDTTPPVDNIQHVKRNIQVDGNISKLNSVELNINKENDFHSAARKYVTIEKQIHHPVVDGYALLHKVNVKESTPSVDDVIPAKQENQIDKADSHPGSSNKLTSKPVQEYLAENKKEPSPIPTLGTHTVERAVTAQEDLKMQQVIQSKAGLELVYKQDQNAPLKPVERWDNYITVNGTGYKVQKLLGRGGSSQVFKVLDPSTTQELAVKCVNLSVAEPSIAQGYLNEIALLRRLQGSETVISMTDFEYAEEKQMLYVVMEKGETDLSRLIKNISKTSQLHIITIIYYWVEILRAVKNIHENGVIHSDLKPANFLLVSGRMKLIDFGIASSIQSDMTSVFKDAQAGTFNYMSPEAVQATHSTNGNQSGFKISYKSDIWSLGCILYNLLYGKTPFQHIVQPWAKVAAITNPDHVIDFPNTRNDCPPVLLKAVQLCLTYDPKKRPTAVELLELPYINYNVV